MANEDGKKGFSGLSDLVSEVSDTDAPVTPPKQKREVNTGSPEQTLPPQKEKQPIEPKRKQTPHSQPVNNVSSGKNRSGSGAIWFFTILGVIFVVCLINSGGPSNSKPSYTSQPSPQSYNYPKSDPAPVDPVPTRYYVTVRKLNMRKSPTTSGTIVTKLSHFDTVSLYPNSKNNGWIKVTDGLSVGWVAERYLKQGEGRIARSAYCRANISRPVNGHIFYQKQKGPHSLTIKNAPGNDVIAKLKDRNGNTIISFYVRANNRYTISSIPSGFYKFQYATGQSYSEECGKLFLDNMQVSEDPSFIDFKITTNGYSQYTSKMEYSLYRVSNGNFRPNSISANNF